MTTTTRNRTLKAAALIATATTAFSLTGTALAGGGARQPSGIQFAGHAPGGLQFATHRPNLDRFAGTHNRHLPIIPGGRTHTGPNGIQFAGGGGKP